MMKIEIPCHDLGMCQHPSPSWSATSWGSQLLAVLLWCPPLPCPSAGQHCCVAISFQADVAETLAMSLEVPVTVISPCHLPLHHLCLSMGKTTCDSKHQVFPSALVCMMFSYTMYVTTVLSTEKLNFCTFLSNYRVVSTIFRWPMQGHMNITLSVPPCLLLLFNATPFLVLLFMYFSRLVMPFLPPPADLSTWCSFLC